MGTSGTNFSSVISAQAVGTADVNAQADAIRKLADAIGGINQKADKVNQHPGFDKFAASVKQGISNPLGAIGGAVESALQTLGPFGVGVAAVAGTFAVLARQGFEWERQLGNLGDRIGDISVRTGLTTKEVGEFDLAMKFAGGTIESLEGIMRKLSQGLADGGEEGRKSAEGLRDLGIRARDVNGQLRPTSDIIVQLSQKLAALPNAFERNAAAIKILGRGALDVLPDLLELSEKLARAKELNLAPSAEDIKRWNAYKQQVEEVDAAWEALKRRMKEPIVGFVSFIIKKSAELGVGGGLPSATELEQNSARIDIPTFKPPTEEQVQELSKQFGEFLNDALSADPVSQAAARGLAQFMSKGLTAAQEQAERLKGKLQQARSEAQQLADSGAALPEAVAKARSEVEATEAAYRRQSDIVKELSKDEERRIALLQKARDLAREQSAFLVIGGSQGAVISQAQIDKANEQTEALKRLQSLPRSITPRERAERAEDAVKPLPAGIQNQNSSQEFFVSPESQRRGNAVIGSESQASPEQLAARFKGATDAEKVLSDRQIQSLRDQYDAAQRIVELRTGPGGEVDAAIRTAAIRQEGLRRERDLTGDLNEFRKQTQRNALEFEQKIAEIQRQRLDNLRNEAGQFFDALLQGPKGVQQFAREFLLGEARKIFQNVVVESLKGVSGNIGLPGKIFQGTILGKDPLKGATDLLKGSTDVLKVATDTNSTATDVNTQALRDLTAALASARAAALSPTGGGGGSAGAGGSSGAFAGLGALAGLLTGVLGGGLTPSVDSTIKYGNVVEPKASEANPAGSSSNGILDRLLGIAGGSIFKGPLAGTLGLGGGLLGAFGLFGGASIGGARTTGGGAPNLASFSSQVEKARSGEDIGAGSYDAVGLQRNSSGLIVRGTSALPDGAYDPGLSHADVTTPTAVTNAGRATPKGAGFSKAAGTGVAVAAGAFGVYSGIKQGGPQGYLSAASSALATAALLDPEPISKAILGVAAFATGLATTVFGDPKAKRAKEIGSWLESHQYQGPDPVSIVQDVKGRDLSYDQRGNLRPIQVTNDNRQYHVSAIDSQDVSRFFERNAAALNRGVTQAVREGGGMVPELAGALGLQ